METYKQQVEGLSKRLSELQTENESLEKRNRLLEKVVQMKDQKPKTPVSIEVSCSPAFAGAATASSFGLSQRWHNACCSLLMRPQTTCGRTQTPTQPWLTTSTPSGSRGRRC